MRYEWEINKEEGDVGKNKSLRKKWMDRRENEIGEEQRLKDERTHRNGRERREMQRKKEKIVNDFEEGQDMYIRNFKNVIENEKSGRKERIKK